MDREVLVTVVRAVVDMTVEMAVLVEMDVTVTGGGHTSERGSSESARSSSPRLLERRALAEVSEASAARPATRNDRGDIFGSEC